VTHMSLHPSTMTSGGGVPRSINVRTSAGRPLYTRANVSTYCALPPSAAILSNHPSSHVRLDRRSPSPLRV
jgi:hypothetical protein